MGRARMTIVGSMGVIALMALGLAAIHRPTRLAANGIFSLALVACFGATVAAYARRDRARAACRGFAFAGWGYLTLSLGPWFEGAVGPYLITTPLIDLAYGRSVPRATRPRTVTLGGVIHFVDVDAEAFWNDTQLNRMDDLGGNRYGFVPSAPYPLYRIGHLAAGRRMPS